MALVVAQSRDIISTARVRSAGGRRSKKAQKTKTRQAIDASDPEILEADDEMDRPTVSARRQKPTLRQKYAGMSNHGIPTFSDDLIRERQRRRDLATQNASAASGANGPDSQYVCSVGG